MALPVARMERSGMRERHSGCTPDPGFRFRFIRATEETLCPLGRHLGAQVGRAARPDVVEMRVEKTSRRAPPKLMQHGKEVEVGVELALGGELLGVAVERDAVHLDVTVLARPGAARQPSL